MFWKKRVVRVLVITVIFVLVLLLLAYRGEGDISCLYTTF